MAEEENINKSVIVKSTKDRHQMGADANTQNSENVGLPCTVAEDRRREYKNTKTQVHCLICRFTYRWNKKRMKDILYLLYFMIRFLTFLCKGVRSHYLAGNLSFLMMHLEVTRHDDVLKTKTKLPARVITSSVVYDSYCKIHTSNTISLNTV
jgi:hypothetical protein